MSKIKAIKILNGYQANLTIIVGETLYCPDNISRKVTSIEHTPSGWYKVTCQDNVVITVKATNDIMEQLE